MYKEPVVTMIQSERFGKYENLLPPPDIQQQVYIGWRFLKIGRKELQTRPVVLTVRLPFNVISNSP